MGEGRPEGAAETLAVRVSAVRREIERRRFAGDDPVVELAARMPGAEVVARVLAAERTGAALTVDGARFNPAEDLAEEALRGAIGALRSWSFAVARVRLDEAAERAHDPALQQRAALFKALLRLVSALVYTPLDEKPRGGADLADLDAVLGGLDRLPAAEQLHYRDEADRLLNLRDAAARGDNYLDAAWTLLRARLAMSAGQDEAAILWLLRLAARHAPALAPGPNAEAPYLAELLDRARARLLAMIGHPAPVAEGKAAPAAAETKAVRPGELSQALAARLGAILGRDPGRGMDAFAIVEWVAPDLAEAGGKPELKGRDRKTMGEHTDA
ncbi:MAG: hypothetical protein AVDCRST_MAG88-3829 [uncultured Thermomicrobiales bacterium]|uniref:Uncharacterized protein n=1 Tax=uncultured Thermomicrobiales bacterium TaxID=1645740 RepID=A0A6J4VQX4_9BACT|nr:MAG: hypothetical protein AVDCRST_MAG88-3829 [uncultured Thermomicrobiales bacterium]